MHVHGAMQGYETHCLTSIYALNPKLIIWEPMHASPPPPKWLQAPVMYTGGTARDKRTNH